MAALRCRFALACGTAYSAGLCRAALHRYACGVPAQLTSSLQSCHSRRSMATAQQAPWPWRFNPFQKPWLPLSASIWRHGWPSLPREGDRCPSSGGRGHARRAPATLAHRAGPLGRKQSSERYCGRGHRVRACGGASITLFARGRAQDCSEQAGLPGQGCLTSGAAAACRCPSGTAAQRCSHCCRAGRGAHTPHVAGGMCIGVAGRCARCRRSVGTQPLRVYTECTQVTSPGAAATQRGRWGWSMLQVLVNLDTDGHPVYCINVTQPFNNRSYSE